MKRSDKDQLQGNLHEAKGAIKEAAGKIVGNEQLEAEGIVEQARGKVQQVVGKIEKSIGK